MIIEGPDEVEVRCAPGDLVKDWSFTLKNVGKAPWPKTTCLCLEESKESTFILVGVVNPGDTFLASSELCDIQSPQKEGQIKYVFTLRETEDGEVFGPNVSIKLKIKQKPVDDESSLYKTRYTGANGLVFNAGVFDKKFRIQNSGNDIYPD
jgi:hypothetical protein